MDHSRVNDLPLAAGPHGSGRFRTWRPSLLALLGGAIAGTLDISFAIVLAHGRGVAAGRILQSVASGLLGRGSYQMGMLSQAIGLACHYGIAVAMAFCYLLLSRHLPRLRRHVLAGAVLYGVATYLAMAFVVVPLSAAPFHVRMTPMSVFTSLFSHVFFVALPIAYLASRANWQRGAQAAT